MRIVGTMLPLALAFGSAATAPGQATTAPPTARPTARAQAAVPAQAPARPAAPQPDPNAVQKLAEILRGRWEAEIAQTNTLYAEFEQVEKLVLLGSEKRYQGMAFLQRPNLAVLNISRKVGDKAEFDKRIICTGHEVVEFSGPTQQITVYPTAQGMCRSGPWRRPVAVPVRPEGRADPAAVSDRTGRRGPGRLPDQHRAVPAIDRDAFASAYLDLNKQTLLPDKLYMLSANGKDVQYYRFTKVMKNQRFQGSRSPGPRSWPRA